MPKSKAFRVVERLHNEEIFDSDYTKVINRDYDSSILVDELKLFKVLKYDEKIELSKKYGSNYVLNIWANIWLNMPSYMGQDWVLIFQGDLYRQEFSYNPTYVEYDNLIIKVADVTDLKVFKRIDQN